jgi:methionine-rich copper-binding protein CopC
MAMGAAVAALIAVPALAHPKLSASTPAAEAVTAAPKTISLRMSEKLEPKFSGVELMRADGTAVPIVSKVGGKDGKTIEATPKGKLAPGKYMVMWHAVAADGHRVKGDYNFTVR